MNTSRILAGSRIYDFKVKTSVGGINYLVIKELQENHKNGQIMIFNDHMLDFLKGLDKALDHIKDKHPKSYSIKSIRRIYPKAYTKWLSYEDDDLKRLYKSGKTIGQLVVIFQRKNGAILARLKKLNIIP